MKYCSIPGFPGYRASEKGEIQTSLPMGKHHALSGVWRSRKPYLNENGYHTVTLTGPDKKVYVRRISRLVLLAFRGVAPMGATDACHVNGNRTDNRLENLRWGTRSENMADAKRHGTIPRGFQKPNCRLSLDDVSEIKRLVAEGVLQKDVAEKFGINRSYVSMIVAGRRRES